MASPALKKLFDGESPAGVYWLKAHLTVGDVSRLAKSKKLVFFHLEGQKIEKKEQFLNHAAIAMKFPSHFGGNWDAFYDCLTDFEWLDARGYVIYFDHTDAFASHHESELETVTEIFQDAVDYWKAEGKSMLVLLSGSHPPEGFRAI